MVPDNGTMRRKHHLYWLTLGIAVLVVLADQGSKWWAEANLSDGQVIPVIGDIIRFQLVYNPGAAFSIGTGFTWVFTIVAGIIVIAVGYYAWRIRSLAWAIVAGLILGGAATHFGDRMFRAPSLGNGHVVDFIAYGNLFIGNVADIVIVLGAAAGVILMMRGIPFRPKTEEEPAKDAVA